MSRKLGNLVAVGRDHGERATAPRGFAKTAITFEGYLYWVRNGYMVEKCGGEAHSNPHIDNCMLCAPNWGVVAVKVSP